MTRTKVELVPAEHLTFVGRFLEVSDEALPLVDRSMLSASTAKDMHGCHAKHAASRILPRDDDPFGDAPLGTSAHEVIEQLMSLPGPQRTTETAMQLLISDARAAWPDLPDGSTHPDRSRWQRVVWEKVSGLWKIEDPATVDVVANEWDVRGVKINGIPFVGYIDRTDRMPDGSLRVVDYKSGKAKGLDPESISKLKRYGDDHADQIRLYKAALEALTNEPVSAGHLYYIGAGGSRQVSFDKTAMNKTLSGFSRAWDELKADVAAGAFPTSPGPLCGWCPLVELCPSARLDGREAKVEVPSAEELGIEVVSATPSASHKKGESTNQQTQEEQMAEYDPGEDFDFFDEPGTTSTKVTAADPEPEPDPEPDVSPEPEPAPRARTAPLAVPEPVEWAPIFGEDKSWFPTAEGLPNANSFGAVGAFGMAELAAETVMAYHQADPDDPARKVRTADIVALAQTFDLIVGDAQQALSGSRTRGDGLSTRMRGALRGTLRSLPVPMGGTAAQWRTWRQRTTRRCITLGQVAYGLLTEPAPAEPFLDLAAEDERTNAA